MFVIQFVAGLEAVLIRQCCRDVSWNKISKEATVVVNGNRNLVIKPRSSFAATACI